MLIKTLLVVFCLALTAQSHAAVLFEDNFDSHADWSPVQHSDNTLECVLGDTCTYPIPSGYYDYRVAARETCSNADGLHNTLNINSYYPRGGVGKSFQMWNEPCLSRASSWGSDGLLGVSLTPQTELYVQYWIRFQSDWVWNVGETSPMQKFLHMSHYDAANGSTLWDFFSGVQNKPRFTPQLAKFGGGTYRTQYNLPHSPLTATRDNSASFNSNVYMGDSPLDWSNSGAPGDGGWHSFQFHVKLNSAGGVADGVSEAWYDGNLVHTKTDVIWVPTGDDPSSWKWNHIWLGGNNYNLQQVNGEQWYAIDDVVVSTTVIPADYVIGTPSVINGDCGTASGQTFSTIPTTNLCSSGTPTAVSGTGTPNWNWGCDGINGGTSTAPDTCTATYSSTPPTPTCSDSIQNQSETGVDCGGPCAACQVSAGSRGMRAAFKCWAR